MEKIYDLWKPGQASQADERAAVCKCGKKTRTAKAHLELTPVTVVSDNKKAFSIMSTARGGLRKTLILGKGGDLRRRKRQSPLRPFLPQFSRVMTNLRLPDPLN